MSRTPARATQADIARAVRAVLQCGASGTIEIAKDGTIRVIVGQTTEKPVEPERDLVF
ncbi:hypothetical protein FG93_00641 [Bosea sp. LC85]|uniref:hypothetical protein n=1 Tax=Bosea sp. LC85 TaxID=1502851 RepID=UPI0004E340DD|nr:hypothetical protein [Bosea sp. LC85]KFC75619.1 hypothetical protein FG93_00641 [Bosea sp. LC85]